MLFNSLTFLVFFIVVFTVYWSVPSHRIRLGWLLLMSWLFYAAWYPSYLVLFLIMTVINWGSGLLVGRSRVTRPAKARWILILTVALDLGNLAFFKYLDFLVQSAIGVWGAVSGRDIAGPKFAIFLPLGISFYTFQLMGYVVDVYRGNYTAVRNPFKIALFKAFFPQLIAGPILRASQFIDQLSSRRRFSLVSFLHGLDLIAIGLFKKVLIADQVGPFVDQVFAAPDGLGSGTLMLGVYAYAAQIYCDFSGYTDIGRGCAYCLGYELPINFLRPYFSCNIVEFWRRWHITLSNWLRDYLYIPLGGSRSSRGRTYVNLIITMALGGLWHGASWCFLVWGLLHGIALSVTRFIHELAGVKPDRPLFKGLAYRLLAIVATFHLVCLGWVFFRAPTFTTAFKVLKGIFSFHLFAQSDLAVIGVVTLGLLGTSLFLFGTMHFLGAMAKRIDLHQRMAWSIARPFVFFVVIVGVLLLGSRGAQQFIYFQF